MSNKQEAAGDAAPIESKADLIRLFEAGEKPKADWRIGTEHEKFVFRLRDHAQPSWEEPNGIRDLLDAVEDYAGEELRREIESYIDTNVEDIGDYEKEYDRMEQDNERLADHQRSVLCDIRDEVDALDTLLQDTRLNRRRMQGAVRIIQQMINREL